MKKKLLGLMLLFGQAFSSYAQQDAVEMAELSLEDLMEMTVNVASASQKATTIRETPGSITVITDEDILKSGARDLNEILMRIPGLDLGRDYGGQMSFGVRGIWGNEGKILFLIDGQYMNETSYGSYTTGNRVPLHQIKKIEIIRGPGSVIYGGVAGLAVISIITKTGEDLDGVSVRSGYTFSEGQTASMQGEASGGFKKDKLDVSFHAGVNRGNLSNANVNYWGAYPVSFADSSLMQSYMMNLGVKYEGLTIRAIADEHAGQRVFEDYDRSSKYRTYFKGFYLGADYRWKVSEKLDIIPAIQWKASTPWTTLGDSTTEFEEMRSNRLQSSLKVNYKLNDHLTIMGGAEYFQIDSRYVNKFSEPHIFEFTGTPRMSLSNLAGFSELVYNSKYGNLIIGGRFDSHSTGGNSLVPRFAYTKAWRNAHVKTSFSNAIKTPMIVNVELNSELRPERLQMVEIEGGVRLAKKAYLTVNLYDSRIAGTYIYSESGGEFVFISGGSIGTRGIESQLQYNVNRFNFRLSHAFYSTYLNEVEATMVEGNKNALMAFPANKINAHAWMKLGSKFHASANIMWLSKRYSYALDTDYEYFEYALDPTLIANVYIGGKDILTKGLNIELGISNLLNNDYFVAMPYGDGLPPLPLMRREFTARVIYDLKFKK